MCKLWGTFAFDKATNEQTDIKHEMWYKHLECHFQLKIVETRSLRGGWELFTYAASKAKCLPHFVFYICLSVRRFVEGRIQLPKMCVLFCLVHIVKRSFFF